MYGKQLGEIEINNQKIRVQTSDKYNIYQRIKDKNIIKNIIIDKDIIVETRPIYPLYYPKYTTQFILCKTDKLLIKPNSEIQIYGNMMIELAIYTIYNNNFNIIDIIPLHSMYKLVLYGTQQHGTIARYCNLKLTNKESYKKGYVMIPIKIRNETRNIREISKILIDASPLKIFYKKGTWIARTQDIEVNILSSSTAIVLYGKGPQKGFEQLEDPPELRPPRLLNRSDMMWGY